MSTVETAWDAHRTRRDETDIAFEVSFSDGTHELVRGADVYQQEQSMTTFFRTDAGRQRVDCWSIRVASFRTDQLVAVRRVEPDGPTVPLLRSV